jgi:hypothetical protein
MFRPVIMEDMSARRELHGVGGIIRRIDGGGPEGTRHSVILDASWTKERDGCSHFL